MTLDVFSPLVQMRQALRARQVSAAELLELFAGASIPATRILDVRSVRELEQLRDRIAPDAMIWVSWPKKASKVPTDITEDVIRAVALPMGYVDVKVCAVSDVWSGLKLVIRKALR